jgi:hypothetical protein
MDIIGPIGRDIMESFGPTFQAYGDMLHKPENASKIQAVERETFSYGSRERQMLDLYTPSDSAPKPASNKTRPILIFAYGGAFISGDKILDAIPDGLVYKNLGYFFAEELGFDTVVIDYRLLGHGAKYPSGGEDVGGVMDWVASRFMSGSNSVVRPRDIFILGNSAGAVHVSTWLFCKQFSAKRDTFVSGEHGVKLTGVVFLGCPFRLDFNGGMRDMLRVYFGGEKETKDCEPTLLMERATHSGTGAVQAWPQLLITVSELDPEDISEAGKEFAKLWHGTGGTGTFMELKGHNHLSPPLSLGTGVEREEAWGFEVGTWMLESIYRT